VKQNLHTDQIGQETINDQMNTLESMPFKWLYSLPLLCQVITQRHVGEFEQRMRLHLIRRDPTHF